MNELLRVACPGNDIFLNTTEQPHITAYLTEFEDTDAVVEAVSGVVDGILPQGECEIYLEDITVSGCYVLWEVRSNTCLQAISDTVVNVTSKYIVPDQPIPGWVEDLSEPERSIKEVLIKEYGSPNVYSQFSPHVTVGYDCTPGCMENALADAAASHSLPNVTPFDPSILGVGMTGDYGTVLRGDDLEDFKMSAGTNLNPAQYAVAGDITRYLSQETNQ